MDKKIILGLCTANRCRSQMFEAIMRHLLQDKFTVISAGTKATFVHHLAIKVLEEINIPVHDQVSKKIESLDSSDNTIHFLDQNGKTSTYLLSDISHVITLCGGAQETCPFFPGHVERQHWPIDDPDQYTGSEEEILPYFRSARDDIFKRAQEFMKKTF